jgi:3-mercaptopyruvate sulfurtransferase SseA
LRERGGAESDFPAVRSYRRAHGLRLRFRRGTFKSADELRQIYHEQKGVDPNKDTIAYCRIGERSSHTWFILKYLLGLKDVKNYDGSWTEYGNLVGADIEKAV